MPPAGARTRTDREPDSLRSRTEDLPAPVSAGSGLVHNHPGAHRLLAVADLTVTTNIRTARRGTLGGVRSGPTRKANRPT